MDSIELFPIPQQSFADGSAFRSYLAENYDPTKVDNALTIIVALTKRPESDLRRSLAAAGFSIRRELGKVFHLAADTEEGALETYFTYEADPGLIMFYTNFRKTEEIPRIKDFLFSDPETSPLFLRPVVMRRILEDLAKKFEDFVIVDFTAKRYHGSKQEAKIRPNVERTFGYWGDDGRETLRELEFNYGVFPSRAIVEIPGVAKFGVDNRGFFTFHKGKLDVLLGILGPAVEEARRAIDAFNGSSFQVFSVKTAKKAFDVPLSVPVHIRLTKKLEFAEMGRLESKLGENGYALLNFVAVEGSLFLSSDVVSKTGHRFRIKADEDNIRMLPDGRPRLAAFMEFYEFVLNEIDPAADLAV